MVLGELALGGFPLLSYVPPFCHFDRIQLCHIYDRQQYTSAKRKPTRSPGWFSSFLLALLQSFLCKADVAADVVPGADYGLEVAGADCGVGVFQVLLGIRDEDLCSF